MALRAAVGISTNPDAFQAGQEAVQKALAYQPMARPHLTLVFSSIRYAKPELLKGIRSVTGNSPLVGCTDAGGITQYGPNRRGVTVMLLESEDIEFVTGIGRNLGDNPMQAGRNLAKELLANSKTQLPPQVAMMFPDGLRGNGADVVRGLQEGLQTNVPIVGGSAGDDFLFKTTYQYYNDQVLTDTVPGVMFRGKVHIGVGVRHGWKPLGVPRTVTKAKNNILYEIDGKPAVSIYEEYFGKDAQDLRQEPLAQMAITYPLGMAIPGQDEYLIRDAISVGEDGSLVCAAEVVEGSKIRLMMGSTETALEAARTATKKALTGLGTSPRAAVIFNCIARDKLFGGKTEEIKVISDTLGRDVQVAGFYTYGEQAPVEGDGTSASFTCHFHNETVVIFVLG